MITHNTTKTNELEVSNSIGLGNGGKRVRLLVGLANTQSNANGWRAGVARVLVDVARFSAF